MEANITMAGPAVVAALPMTAEDDINVGFTLLSGYLVFFMQAGFAMLSAGSVRAKNAKNIILLNLLDACFGCFAWYVTGYAFAFGDDTPLEDGSYAWVNPFIGHKYFFQIGLPRGQYANWFFQFTFAATSATIVSGAVAERCRFESYICYNLILVAFVYPVVAHWVWSPFGWMSAWRTPQTSTGGYTLLFGSGVYDFAGDGPVHMVGGFASLIGAYILGPRIGRFDAEGRPVDMPGHNAALTLLGVFLLWFGWFGFNPGSTNAILQPSASTTNTFTPGFSSISAAIAVNTTVSAAAATISTLLVAMLHSYISMRVVVWDLIVAGNGALAGLVAITGGCAFVDTWAAWVIGFLAGGVYYGASKLILHKWKVDDPLDAIAVHAACGAWGMIGCALFASPHMVAAWYGASPTADVLDPNDASMGRAYGLFMGGGGRLLGANIIYILVIAAWTIGLMAPFFWMLKKAGILRVPPEIEVTGLDVSYHGGTSYPGHMDTNPGGGGHGGGGGGGSYKQHAETKMLIEEAVAEALRQVERRGWTAPPEGSVNGNKLSRKSPSSSVPNNGMDLDSAEALSNAASAGAGGGGGGMKKSLSLAELQASMQKNYQPLMSSDGSNPPESVPEESPLTQ